jgi:hypothetical protein
VILEEKWPELTDKDVEPATGYVAKYLIGYHAQRKGLVSSTPTISGLPCIAARTDGGIRF